MTGRPEDRVRTLQRSWLFLPANNRRFLTKAIETAADVIILDLEDSVLAEEKIRAREMAFDALVTVDFREKPRTVRVNGITTPWGEEDIESSVRAGADLLMIPKADGEDVVSKVESVVNRVEQDSDRTAAVGLVLLIETPLGLINVERTVFSSERIAGLCFGSGDYSHFTRGMSSRDELEYLYPRSRIVAAARAAGVTPIGAAYRVIGDLEGLSASAHRDKSLGYAGKTVIHPSQVDPVNAAFTPTPTEVGRARRVIAAFDAAQKEGRGATMLDGQLVELPHVVDAREILEIAEEAMVLESDGRSRS